MYNTVKSSITVNKNIKTKYKMAHIKQFKFSPLYTFLTDMLLGRVCTKFLLFLYKKVHLFVTRVVKVQQILFDLNFVERKMFCYSSKISSSSQD